MEILNVTDFTKCYFKAHHCRVTERKNNLLEITLTEEMDKKIMNRPFYWHYVHATNTKGVPKTLFLQSNASNEDPQIESIHFGSTRFQQIMDDITKEPHFIQTFEQVKTSTNKALYPWLFVNIKISYHGMQTKDEIFSLGLDLITGKMIVNMMEHLQQIKLNPVISSLCYSLTPVITYESGLKRIEHVLDIYLEEQQHTWAIDSMHALEEEVQLINLFYEEDTEEKRKELKTVKDRYQPQITFHVLSGGIVHVTDSFSP